MAGMLTVGSMIRTNRVCAFHSLVAMVRKISHRLVIVITAGHVVAGLVLVIGCVCIRCPVLYFSYRLNLFGKAVLAYLFYLGVNYLEDNFACWCRGDRLGSDLLCQRIDEGMYRMIDGSVVRRRSGYRTGSTTRSILTSITHI